MNVKKSLPMLASAVAIAAGGFHQANAGIDRGGSPGSGSGTITSFGSIFVNGVRYQTDNAVFIVDGQLGAEADLRVGQVVSLYGSIDADGTNGTADIVVYDDAVDGPVSSVDAETNSIIVLGRRVVVTGDTAIAADLDIESIEDLESGDAVEVSGFTDSHGNVIATYVGPGSGNGGYDLTGIVDSVDAGRMVFEIDGVEIDYGSAATYGIAGAPVPGSRLEIAVREYHSGGRIVAHSIWPAISGFGIGGAGTRGEIEGYVTDWLSWSSFDIDGIAVRVGWNTEFRNGWYFGLGMGGKVEVEGTFDENGVLAADVVEFERVAEIGADGRIDAIVGDTVYVDGLRIRLTTETVFEDDSDEDDRRLAVTGLDVGDTVDIRGFESNGEFVATRLERDD